MGAETRRQALDKLAAMRPQIAYPAKWRDYGTLEIRRDDLVGNAMRAYAFNYDFWMAKLGQKVDRDEWFTAPQTVNAFFSANHNVIVFPAGILQPPFFDGEAEDAANYGGIGTVIGHEISHAFDDEGSRFDGEGNLRNWWSAEDRARFEAKARGLVAQYDAFSPLPGYNVNGQLTLGENIADNAGLAIALKAYHISLNGKPAPMIGGFTGDQRFYLSFGQIWRTKMRDSALRTQTLSNEHAVAEFRVIGPTRNQDEWYAAFDVKPGDKYYLPPDQRVHLW
jgi:putative endopeptidase